MCDVRLPESSPNSSSQIQPNDTVMDIIVKMSQGNPGAVRTLCELVKADPVMGMVDLLLADDMGLRGPAIWLAYSDFAGHDVAKLQVALRDRSQELVDTIRRKGYHAVTGGASR